MKNAFQLVPLLVAAALGALFLYLLGTSNVGGLGGVGGVSSNGTTTSPSPNYLFLGALTGMGVQIGVRLFGVS
jgi:hypothetical protein